MKRDRSGPEGVLALTAVKVPLPTSEPAEHGEHMTAETLRAEVTTLPGTIHSLRLIPGPVVVILRLLADSSVLAQRAR